MASYSIKELEKLSGIKAHTIRIWEKRYRILKPDRTDTNIRYYCDDDLKRLLNIVILNRLGIKISKISNLSDSEMSEKVMELSVDPSNSEGSIENLIIAMVELDEVKFDKTLSRYIMHEGFENAVVKVIFPFFEQIGILWQTGSVNPVHEHFVSNLFRQKLMVAIDNINVSDSSDTEKVVMFLPEGEYHELALLFYNYLIKKMGKLVYYLGNSVPFNDIKQVVSMVNPNYLFLSITSILNMKGIKNYVKNLSESCPNQKILITGLQVKESNLEFATNVVKISSPQDIAMFFKK
jgi:DNA-binding transcriptional MerR regulator